MNRYVSKPRAAVVSDEEGEPAWTADTVFEGDDEPVYTGLLDQHGNDLYRQNDREPIGYKLRR